MSDWFRGPSGARQRQRALAAVVTRGVMHPAKQKNFSIVIPVPIRV